MLARPNLAEWDNWRAQFLAEFGFPPIAGGSADDLGDSASDQDDRDSSSDDGSDDDDGGDGAGSATDQDDSGLKKARDDAAKERVRRKKLAQDLETLKAELEGLKNKDRSDEEKTAAKLERLKGLEQENAELKATNEALKLEGLVRDQSKVKFNVGPSRVLKLLDDLEDLRDENGIIDESGFISALEKLATELPSLVEASKNGDGDKEDDGKKTQRSTGSGPAPGARKKQNAGIDRQELAKRFPILRSRV